MPTKPITEMQKDVLSKRIIEDLRQFFRDNFIEVKQIILHEKNNSIKFYQVHFDNKSVVDIDVITKSLDKFGYVAKSFNGNLPRTFFLLVWLNKKI